MAANNLGTAYIKIAPEMEGIQSAISRGLEGAVKSAAPAATAMGTIVQKGISTTLNAVSSSMDRAIARVDTLNAFPKIMRNLGFSTEESSSAIEKLSSRIEGLPTGLDEIVNYTQRLASTMGNLNKDVYNATNLAIAFNDAALSGGKGQYEANRAFEQFSQVLSRGRPSMQDWKIMMEVMPGQLKQMAKYMGENNDSLKEYAKQAGKTVDQLDGMDLYNWISEDKNEHAKERLQDLTKALIDLDNNGGAGIASFKEQVGDATHTIGNALSLIPLRISNAIAEIVQAFGAGDVYTVIDKFTSKFKDVGNWIAKNIVPIIKERLIPVLKGVLDVAKNIVQFVAANKWVQDALVGILNTIIAFKAIKTIKTVVAGVIAPIASLVKNIESGASAFWKAWDAGLSFSSSMKNAANATTGATSKIASMTGTLTASRGAIGGMSGALASLGAVIGGITLVVLEFQAAFIGLEIEQTKATTKMRDYERAHYSVKQAAESAKRAIDLQRMAVDDLKDAQQEAVNYELEALEAKKQAAYYQDEMNRLIAEGKQNTDDYRIAELNYTKAINDEARANENLAKANEKVAETKQEIDGLNSSGIYKANLVIGNTLREAGAYGDLAAQLDALKDKTITYRDEYGNMVTMTAEKTQEMVGGIAEQLANSESATGEVWRKIVDMANTEGISFSEACARYGKEAGENIPGKFSQTFKDNSYLITDASKEGAQKAIDGLKSEMAQAYLIGKGMTEGVASGLTDKMAAALAEKNGVARIKAILGAMKDAAAVRSPSKKTAEIGKFLSLGLAEGIDDYADIAVNSAEDAMSRVLTTMNGGVGQYQPDTAITGGMAGSGGQVTQYNTFNVDSELDVKDVSKRLGWQVATAL